MKRFLIGLVLLLLVFSLSGCGKEANNTNQADEPQAAEGQQDNIDSGNSDDINTNDTIDENVSSGDNTNSTDYSMTEAKAWASTAEYINAGCAVATGDKIKHMTGNVMEDVAAALLPGSMQGMYTGYDGGQTKLETMFFTATDGRTVMKLRDADTDCVIIFEKMIVVDANYNNYHFFGQIKGTFEGTQYDGNNSLLMTEGGGWCYLNICQNDELIVDNYTLCQIPSEEEFITAQDTWIGTYVTDENNEEQAKISIYADEFGLTYADINSTVFQGTVWCYQNTGGYYYGSESVIEYYAPDYDSECRCFSVMFTINETTSLCEEINYNIVGNAGLVNGYAYREKDYIAPAALANQDNAGVWGVIPVHEADAQYFTPMTEDYLVEYIETWSMPLTNNYDEYTDVQKLTLYSYNGVGKVINKKEKYICQDAETAQKVVLFVEDQLQYRAYEKPVELICVDNIIYQYETDDIDYNPNYLNNEKNIIICDLESEFFFGRHLLEVNGDFGHAYYWFSKIMTEEEGRQYNQNYHDYFKPYTGEYYLKDAEKSYSNAIILYSGDLFENGITVPVIDNYDNNSGYQTNLVQVNQDGSLTAIYVIYDQFYVVAELSFNEDKTIITGQYYQYAFEGGCPTFDDYKDREYNKKVELGEYVYSEE